MQILRGYKFKLDLNQTQESTLNSWLGANRCLYNIAVLQRSMNDYRQHRIRYKEQAGELRELKKEFPWMKEAPAQTLQQTLMHVENAFTRFFKGESEYPRIKKKRAKVGIKFPTPESIRVISDPNPKRGLVELPKIGILRFRKSRELEGELRSCTISKGNGAFYISFLCRVERNKPTPPARELGIDRGIAHTLAFSRPVEGSSFHDLPIDKIKGLEDRIARLQKKTSNKKRFSKNWVKTKKKIGTLHHRIACIRHDFLLKSARTIAKNHGFIVIEVSFHVKNGHEV